MMDMFFSLVITSLITVTFAQQRFKICSDGTRSFLKCYRGQCDLGQRCECDGGVISGTGSFVNQGFLNGEDRCFCCGGSRTGIGVVPIGGGVVPIGGRGGVVQPITGSGTNFGFGNTGVGRCPDGSNPIRTCQSDGDCLGDYFCVRSRFQQQGNCCPSCLGKRRQSQVPGIVGSFIPNCFGQFYAAEQRHSSTGYSWCVTQHGVEIPSTRLPPNSPRQRACDIERQRFQGNTGGNFINTNPQGFNQNQKLGQCPSISGIGNIAFGQTCNNDYQCAGTQKCCYTNSGRRCVSPVNGGFTNIGGTSGTCFSKPGQCGTILVTSTFLGSACQCDSDCPGTMKCCLTSGGRRCVQSSNSGGIIGGTNTGINAGQCFSNKAGQCPFNQGTNLFGQQCQCDNHCPGNQKCCYNRCTNPSNQFGGQGGSQICSLTKGGVCPFSGTTGVVGGVNNQCQCDTHCPGSQKCCATNFGRQCRSPLNNFISTNCAFTRQGICPAISTVGINRFNQGFSQCQCDNECQANQKCCTTASGRRCMYITGNSFGTGVTKPGFCPLPPFSRNFLSRNQCQYDDQCQGTQKCCQMYNGYECVEPSSTQQQQCGPNAEYVQCQNPCPTTCNNPNPSPCPSIACSPGCQCKRGFVRQGGSPEAPCVEQRQCNTGIGTAGGQSASRCRTEPNKEYRTCASACPIGCNNKDDPPATCTLNCVAGCFCQQGYIFRDANNWRNSPCVKPEGCSGPGPNPPAVNPGSATNCFGDRTKVFKRCGTACPIGCDNVNNPPRICTSNCVQGCFCTDGYVFEDSRNWRTSRCIPSSNCDSSVGRGGSGTGGDRRCRNDPFNRKEYRTCGPACPRGCDNIHTVQSCTQRCVAGCFCREPYILRNAADWVNSDCVLQTECGGYSGTGSNVYGDGSAAGFAVARIIKRAGTLGNIDGTIRFAQEHGGVRISGSVKGLPPGKHAMIIHALGDGSCTAVGGHFNPEGTNHGDPNDLYNRHAGDLGNIPEPVLGTTNVNILDRKIALEGRFGVIGRTLVIHERPDDFGRGLGIESKINGNVGPALACGVIGRANPANIR